MKELDVVHLTKEFEGFAIGIKGTIVLEYDGKFFEVEFFDDDGNTIDVLITPVECIELEKSFKGLLCSPFFIGFFCRSVL